MKSPIEPRRTLAGRLQNALFDHFYRRLPIVGPWLERRTYASSRSLPGDVRLRGLYRHRRLLRPHYYLGVRRALDLAQKVDLKRFSILEFGVAEGNGILYLQNLCRALRPTFAKAGREVRIFGFDTFTGLPDVESTRDGLGFWKAGDFPGDLDDLTKRIDGDFVGLVPGLFNESIPRVRSELAEFPPLFIIVDCDLYSSTVSIFDGLLDLLPPASYWYFDDTSLFFFSERVGERLAIREFNAREGNRFEFSHDYRALGEPVPAHMPHTQLYYCVAGDYIDRSRASDRPDRLILDSSKYGIFDEHRRAANG